MIHARNVLQCLAQHIQSLRATVKRKDYSIENIGEQKQHKTPPKKIYI